MTMYEKYCQLDIDGTRIGLEKSDMCVDYFCTPLDATVIGWENSIHYCFIRGYRDMVFAVNPESCVDKYVYPLAMNFKDFLRLILACGSTTAVEQIIGWSKEQFDDRKIKFSNEYYDTLGLERPDGSENEMAKLEFGAVTFSFLKKER